MLSTDSICLILLLLTIVYAWCRYSYGYWERHGIPYMKPLPLIGNTKVIFTQSTSIFLYMSEIYNNFKTTNPAAVGIYILNKPALLLREPQLIKSVLIKEFQKFKNRYGSCDPHGDALGSNNLFFVRNPKWKELRMKFTSVFTLGKIKQMYPLISAIGIELEQHLASYQKNNNSFITEIKELCALYTTDVIATIAFGIQANSLKNPNADFRKQGRKFFTFTFSRAFDFFIAFFYPNLTSTLKTKIFTPEFSEFLRDTISHVIIEREKSGVKRNDLIDVFVDLKKEFVAKDQYDDAAHDLLVAQAAVFLTAGFETSSSTMTFALYELAKHPDLQKRLRKEICDALAAEQGELSYETISSLPYLDMTLAEVLRLYPVLSIIDREHMAKDDDKPFDLRPYYNYTLPKHMAIYIPIFALQRDPQYWPNPNTFDPERFTPENKKLQIPMTYLPFGVGPRNCIGMRIGLLQSKIGLAHILRNHYVSVCDKTPADITFDPLSFVSQQKGGMYLNIVNDRLYEERTE